MPLADPFTGIARTVLQFLMLKSPMRTSIGATGGVFVGLLLNIFSPKLHSIDLSAVTDVRLAMAGIFLANVSALFDRGQLSDAIEDQFRLVARGVKAGELSKAQAKIYYGQIITKALQQSKLTTAAQREVDTLGSEINAEEKKRSSRQRTRAVSPVNNHAAEAPEEGKQGEHD